MTASTEMGCYSKMLCPKSLKAQSKDMNKMIQMKIAKMIQVIENLVNKRIKQHEAAATLRNNKKVLKITLKAVLKRI